MPWFMLSTALFCERSQTYMGHLTRVWLSDLMFFPFKCLTSLVPRPIPKLEKEINVGGLGMRLMFSVLNSLRLAPTGFVPLSPFLHIIVRGMNRSLWTTSATAMKWQLIFIITLFVSRFWPSFTFHDISHHWVLTHAQWSYAFYLHLWPFAYVPSQFF